jgi:Glycosyl transferases group 1
VTTTEELCRYYSAADLLIYLGLEDNLPNVILEAMAVGAPVLGFNTGGVGDMIIDGVTGNLVRCGDVTNLAGRLAVLLSDSKKLAWLGMNSRETALGRFSEPVVGLELRKLYEAPGLCGKAGGGIDSRISGDFELAAQRTTLAAMVKGYRSLEKEFHAGGKKFDELQKARDAFKKHYRAVKTQYNALKRQYDVLKAQLVESEERCRQKSLWELFKERLKDGLLRFLRD